MAADWEEEEMKEERKDKRKEKIKDWKRYVRAIGLAILVALSSVSCLEIEEIAGSPVDAPPAIVEGSATLEEVPDYSGEPYVEINGNQPEFTQEEITSVAFESHSELDDLGRCGVAEACIGEEIMPTEERGKIGHVKPTGWKTVKYDQVEGHYLYNRCHLIGYQLSGENANERNLITGTRYMNTVGMLPFENRVADYVHETKNHVMYRVTPLFLGEDLVASGVQMEALSVEDGGAGVCFHVYVYNVQPEITIDYATGENWLADEAPEVIQSTGTAGASFKSSERADDDQAGEDLERTYIVNKGTMKFHTPDCPSVSDMKARNKKEFTGSREELIRLGYDPCGRCKP